MNHAACVCVYNDWRMIAACVRQFPEWVDKILVLHSERPWFGGTADDAIRVQDELGRLGDQRVEYVRLPWKTEHEQRNWGLGRLYDYQCVYTIDADEFLTPEGWERIRVETLSDSAFSFLPSLMKTYWKTWDYQWIPEDTHKPVIAMNPKRNVFFDKRSEVAQLYRELPITLYHLSWVRTDKDVEKKIENYMHAGDFDGKAWLRDVWHTWKPGDTDIYLRPYGSEKGTIAVYSPVPKSIQDYFNESPLDMV